MKKEEVKSKLFDIDWRKLLTGDIELSRVDFIGMQKKYKRSLETWLVP